MNDYESYTELNDARRVGQDKYVYYVVALAVTCIGFTIYRTHESLAKWSLIPYFFAIVAWGYSIYSGLKHLRTNMIALDMNARFCYDMVNIEKTEDRKSKIKQLMEDMKPLRKRGHRLFMHQQFSFYAGLICFFISHIWQILERTS